MSWRIIIDMIGWIGNTSGWVCVIDMLCEILDHIFLKQKHIELIWFKFSCLIIKFRFATTWPRPNLGIDIDMLPQLFQLDQQKKQQLRRGNVEASQHSKDGLFGTPWILSMLSHQI